MITQLNPQLNLRQQIELARTALNRIEQILKDETSYNLQTRNPNTEAAIIEMTAKYVCTFFGIKLENLQSPSREGILPYCRHCYHKLLKDNFTGLVAQIAASKFINRDHTCGIAGIKKLNGWIETNPDIADQWHDLRERYIKIAAEHFKN